MHLIIKIKKKMCYNCQTMRKHSARDQMTKNFKTTKDNRTALNNEQNPYFLHYKKLRIYKRKTIQARKRRIFVELNW